MKVLIGIEHIFERGSGLASPIAKRPNNTLNNIFIAGRRKNSFLEYIQYRVGEKIELINFPTSLSVTTVLRLGFYYGVAERCRSEFYVGACWASKDIVPIIGIEHIHDRGSGLAGPTATRPNKTLKLYKICQRRIDYLVAISSRSGQY